MPIKSKVNDQSESTLFTGQRPCKDMSTKEICFCVRKYKEGFFETVFHCHVPKRRISQDRMIEALRTLVSRYSEWKGEWILHSLLNDRGGEPQRYPGFTYGASYPEPGVLRHTVSGADVHSWCDVVISKEQFRCSVDPRKK
jgi:hypothetical protein